MRIYKDISGQRFGKLIALNRIGSNLARHSIWLCKCDCGHFAKALLGNLQSGGVSSCGCLFKGPIGLAGFNALYYRYNYRAFHTDHKFLLSKDDFRNLVSKPCFYCGKDPSERSFSGNDVFIYSSLDRIDYKGDYSFNNVVPACKACNIAKHKLTSNEFILLCKRIAYYHKDD